ncbi:SDR family NAD(P)-dependent oxidoreductase [Rhodococcus sp. HNM0569]|uniref:SDR family NAD(P)-dependent oxidoreductase n=1 Tax=Rhodococcus sp. HNM0569 TaxID=2716340 RepID=UPI00146C5297|nr:SDR family NAD(P)-dependent oxidoreductase [Rhodococcus sp. HNM0569]NLU83671.1 SDR family NAD(P)-dependent oxidoreductase [Rhodococcus sp. HNM0569]
MSHTIVMTGASRGIGRVAADQLLHRSRGAHLVAVVRDAAGLRLGGNASSVVADLNSLSSIRAAATEICERLDRGDLPPLRYFVGNAGIQHTDDLTAGPDGLESTFTVNVLANHMFVRAFRDRFTAGGRIAITTSDTHFGDLRHNMAMVPAPVWREPEVLARTAAFPRPETTRAGRTAYSTSKLAVLYLVHEYARRLPAGVDVVAFNPGFVPGTELARNAGVIDRFLMRNILPLLTHTPFGSSPEDAGRRLADAVLGDAVTGSYIDRDRPARSSPESTDVQRERKLWEAVERLVASDPAM